MNFQKHIVKQKDLTDCGAACLLMLIKFYGGNNSIDNVRNLSGTSIEGTTLLGMHEAANKLGFNAQGCSADLKSIQEHENPLILHLTIDSMEHFVVLFNYDTDNDQFIIGDPAIGLVTYTSEKLLSVWQSKTCLTVKKNEQFKKLNTNLDGIQHKLKWILSQLKEDRSLLILSAVLGILIACTGLVTAVFSQYMIDEILPGNNEKKLVFAVLLLGLILLTNNLMTYVRSILLFNQRKDFNIRINSYFLKNLLKLPLSFFRTRKSGDFVSRLNDSFKIQSFIDEVVGTLVVDALIVIASLALLFFYSTKIGLLTLLAIPAYLMIMAFANKRLLQFQKEVMIAYSNTESNYINLIKGIATIKLFGKEDVFRNQSKKAISIHQNKDFQLRKSAASINFKWSLVNTIFLTSIMVLTGYLVIDNQLQLGAFVATISVFSYFLPSLSKLAVVIISFNESKVAFERMLEYTNSPKESYEGEQFEELNSLVVKNLYYRYTGKPLLIKGIDFEIKKNQITAIIGESGCGKSTLVNILERIYDYEEGSILVNKKPLDSYQLSSWRNSLGVISQQPDFFNGTVIDNILMYNSTPNEKEELFEFMQQTGMDQFVKKMNQGYDTLVGENGAYLSGGQKQVISFARVLFKEPKILILDEATSAMDKNTERFFLNLLLKLKTKTPILYITHRIDTLKGFADTVKVMVDGEIVDQVNSGFIQDKLNHNENLAVIC